LRNEEMVAIDADFHADQQRVYQRLAGDGMRVLGFARGVVPARPVTEYAADGAVLPLTNLDFIGMTGLTDPPKDGVPEAVSKCREAGIRVFMVTGDHPFTAEAIARQVWRASRVSGGYDASCQRLSTQCYCTHALTRTHRHAVPCSWMRRLAVALVSLRILEWGA
jgi:phosphoserine phosphatase